MKILNTVVMFILAVAATLTASGAMYLVLHQTAATAFFPTDIRRGIIVCHDDIANKAIVIPFEKMPRVYNNWIEIKSSDGKSVALTNLNCVITYEPKPKEE